MCSLKTINEPLISRRNEYYIIPTEASLADYVRSEELGPFPTVQAAEQAIVRAHPLSIEGASWTIVCKVKKVLALLDAIAA